ncbi:MAG: allantoate amidohydrolase [Pseudomonadota bacterium]
MFSIDEDRLWRDLMRSAQIGPGRAGGLSRLSLSDADGKVRRQLLDWAEEAGLPAEVDAAGNMFLRLAGKADVPPVLVGSHLDTQVAGGRFDGILGVLAGLEICRTLKDNGHVPARPIEVVNWTNEEGARFAPPMMASAVFSGAETLHWLYDRRDDEDVRLLDALEAIGFRGAAPVGKPIDSYFELHIEQGPELFDKGITAGIVTGGFAVRGILAKFHGETAHTGPTPMARRKNALVGAAIAAAAVDAIGHANAPVGKATVARLTAWPNKPGILSSYAELTIDARHADPHVADTMREEMLSALKEAAKSANVQVEVAGEWRFGDETFDEGCIQLLRDAAIARGVSHRDILSQAGHDAYYVSRVAPTAILFSPCVDGITHNEAEDVPREATMAAVNVLMDAVLARANRP